MLDSAPVPALAVEAALAERIVAAAQRSPRIVKLEDARPAAPDATLDRSAALSAVATASPRRPRLLLGREARAVGLLAASLAIGVVLGNSELTPQILPELADIAGLTSDGGLVQVALSDEVAQ